MHAVLVVGAEEVGPLVQVLARLGGVDRHPAEAGEVELRPAVIARDLPLAVLGRQREADGEAGRDARGPVEADEQGVEVGAVAPLGVAGPGDVAVPPAGAALVVRHRLLHVVVDGARLFEVGPLALGHRPGQRLDAVVERHQAVRLQPLRGVRGHGPGRPGGKTGGEVVVERLPAAHPHVHLHGHLGLFGVGHREVEHRVAVAAVLGDHVGDRRRDAGDGDLLEIVAHRHRDPDVDLAGVRRQLGDPGLVGEFEVPRLRGLGGGGGSGGGGGQRAEDDQQRRGPCPALESHPYPPLRPSGRDDSSASRRFA